MSTQGDAWIARIDKVRGVIDLTVCPLGRAYGFPSGSSMRVGSGERGTAAAT